MADQFDAFQKEVEEDLNRDRIAKLWERYQYVIMAGVAAIILGVGGFKYLEHRRQVASETGGGQFAAALKSLSAGKPDEATKALSTVAASGTSYAALARLRLAAADAQNGKTADAVAAYEAVANQSSLDPLLQDFARLQTAMLKVDTADWTEMQNRLNPLATDSNSWRHAARELLGMAALKAGIPDQARTQFERLLGDRETPASISERVGIMMAALTQAELAKSQPAPQAPAATAPAVKTETKTETKSEPKKK
jgi:hypothetical protein